MLNDIEITRRVEEDDMIEDFVPQQEETGVVSYGLSSFGYDLRVGHRFKIFHDVGSVTVDPKHFNEGSFVEKTVENVVTIPPNSFMLGYAMERIKMPPDLMGLCVGKSTYARCGLIVNMTPVEPTWEGYLTLEVSNTTPLPAKIYAGEGLAQIIFFQGTIPHTTYDNKHGKYQNQAQSPTLPKVIQGVE